MKLTLEIRDVEPAFIYSPPTMREVMLPIVMVPKPDFEAGELPIKFVWLETFTRPIPKEELEDRIMRLAAFGKPLCHEQAGSSGKSLLGLPIEKTKSGEPYYKANMIGLWEQIQAHGRLAFGNPDSETGSAYLMRVRHGGSEFYGVHADSYGAAKKFILQFDTPEYRKKLADLGLELQPFIFP